MFAGEAILFTARVTLIAVTYLLSGNSTAKTHISLLEAAGLGGTLLFLKEESTEFYFAAQTLQVESNKTQFILSAHLY